MGFRHWGRALDVALHYARLNGVKFRVRGRFDYVWQEWRWHVEEVS